MSLPPADALAVVYVLADQWMRERQLLEAVGVEDPDRLDTVLQEAGRRPAGRAEQIAQTAAFVASAGGEM